MVEIFKTNVIEQTQAMLVQKILSNTFPQYKINFDLSDCDKVLRIEGESIVPKSIIALLEANAYDCELLND